MTKKIPLTQNQFALVDDEDYNTLIKYKWHAIWDSRIKNYYATHTKSSKKINGKLKQKTIYMHRIILNAPKNRMVDHINHNPLDNRKCNLRIVSNRQNQQNQKRKTSSKYPGVYFHKSTQRWMARICINGKTKYLGSSVNELDVAKLYEQAVREKCGEELVCKTGRIAEVI